VVVQGVGAVGLSAVALARLSGAGTIIAVGGPSDRLDLAVRMGADLPLDLDRTSREERLALVMDRTGGRGADLVIEAAGSPRAIEEGFDLVRDGGAYVIAGHYTDGGPSEVNGHRHVNRKHLEIRGCWGSEPGHFVRALRLLERHAHQVPWRDIGARTYPLTAINEALAGAASYQFPKALVRP
jgi:L-iditol 2-dehydrogenase